MSSEVLPQNYIENAYQELKEVARRKLKMERTDHTLQPTALVHEVYVRLQPFLGSDQWQGRDHFMAVAAETMRRILVEHARRRNSEKRGGNNKRHSLQEMSAVKAMSDVEILAVHEALNSFALEDPIAAELVKLRIFAGFSQIDAARHLNLNKSKADRIWSFAKARLFVLMGGHEAV